MCVYILHSVWFYLTFQVHTFDENHARLHPRSHLPMLSSCNSY